MRSGEASPRESPPDSPAPPDSTPLPFSPPRATSFSFALASALGVGGLIVWQLQNLLCGVTAYERRKGTDLCEPSMENFRKWRRRCKSDRIRCEVADERADAQAV